jgi:hypothetical protein
MLAIQYVRRENLLGASAIMLRKINSIKSNRRLGWTLYKLRHLVENAFA